MIYDTSRHIYLPESELKMTQVQFELPQEEFEIPNQADLELPNDEEFDGGNSKI